MTHQIILELEFELKLELEFELELELHLEIELKLLFVLEKAKSTVKNAKNVSSLLHCFCHWQTWFIWAEIQMNHSCQLKWTICTISKGGKIVYRTNFQNRYW